MNPPQINSAEDFLFTLLNLDIKISVELEAPDFFFVHKRALTPIESQRNRLSIDCCFCGNSKSFDHILQSIIQLASFDAVLQHRNVRAAKVLVEDLAEIKSGLVADVCLLYTSPSPRD